LKYTPRSKPFPHQSAASVAAARARNYAIFFEPRLGKTKAALDVVGVHALAGRVKRVLVICPAIARDVWEEQLHQHYPYEYEAETYEDEWMSSITRRAHLPTGPTRFFIAGREETFRRTRNKNGYVRKKQEIIERWKPDLIVIDESHEYQRPGGVGAQDGWRLIRRLRSQHAAVRDASVRDSKQQPWVLLLSGTPNPKGWRPLFSQFRLMDESLLGTSVAQFDDRHVVYGHGRRRWTIIKYHNTARLERILRENSSAISAEEAGLANKVFLQKLSYTLPPVGARMYLDMVDEFVAEWEEGVLTAKNAGVKRLRLLQILGGFTTDGQCIHRAAQERLQAYVSLLLEQGESVVVYSRFTPEVEAATETLDRAKFRTFRVDGSTSTADRRQAISSLARRPDNPTAISAQVQALSQAVELVGAAEVVYMGIPDGWTQYFQTSRRVMGPNQSRPVRLTFLTVPGTVHALQMQSLRKKEDWHQRLMQDPRRYLTSI
jgi:SNF2 family DNA or RNA helicase